MDDDAEEWLGQWCLQLGQLTRPSWRVDQRLVVRVDGEPLGPATAGRFRKVSTGVHTPGVELGISTPTLAARPRGRSKRKAARVKRSVRSADLPDPVDDGPGHRGHREPPAGQPGRTR